MAERRVEHIMGMPITIDVCDALPSGALNAAFAWLREVDATFSSYRKESEITRLNHGRLEQREACAEVQQVLTMCDAARAQTNGFFDVRVRGRLDPSGLVKGWALERVAQRLERAGARRFHVNAGGDIVLRGDQPWRVGIQHPLQRDALACVVEMSDGAVATSGTYERGAHIINPHSGRPPTGVLSVTVIGPDLAMADAYATAAFAMGTAGAAWTLSLDRYDAMTLLSDERVLCTPGFMRRCPGGSPAASLRAR